MHCCRNLGDVSTNHHAVSLRVKSLLDSCNEGLDEHDNSDQSSNHADDEEEAGSVLQVGAFLPSAIPFMSQRTPLGAPRVADGWVCTSVPVHTLSSSNQQISCVSGRWVLLRCPTHTIASLRLSC